MKFEYDVPQLLHALLFSIIVAINIILIIMSCDTVAASVTSFAVGNISGAIVCICLLLLIKCLMKKKRVLSKIEGHDNTTNSDIYESIDIDNNGQSSNHIVLEENTAYGQQKL